MYSNINRINEEWNEIQNDAPFVTFYDMHAVTFVLPDKMADVSIVGLQWFIPILELNMTIFESTGLKLWPLERTEVPS